MEHRDEHGPGPGGDQRPGASARSDERRADERRTDERRADERRADERTAGREERVPTNVRPVDIRDYVRFDPDRAVRVRMFATDVLTVDLWCLEPHQSTDAMHLEEIDVAYTVLGGTAWFVTDEGEIGLGPLGAMLIPAGVVHGIDNQTVDPVVVLAAASPPDAPPNEITVDEPVEGGSEAVWLPGDPRGLMGRLKRLFGSGD